MNNKLDVDPEVAKILCAWCAEPLAEKGIEAYYGAYGCDSCGPDEPTIEIKCYNSKCPKYKKVIYSK